MRKIFINKNGINKIPIINKKIIYKIINYTNKNNSSLLNKRSLTNNKDLKLKINITLINILNII